MYLVCLNGRAGGVMLAATGRRSITISNEAALTVAYGVKVLVNLYDECVQLHMACLQDVEIISAIS
jgi:hypothetical protein